MKLSDFPVNEHWGTEIWEEVFGGGYGGNSNMAEYALKGGPASAMTAEAVAEVLWFHADSPDDYASLDMACVVQLGDDTYGSCEAGCDTTGWDCRSSVTWKVGTLDQVLAELSPHNRERAAAEMTGRDD